MLLPPPSAMSRLSAAMSESPRDILKDTWNILVALQVFLFFSWKALAA